METLTKQDIDKIEKKEYEVLRCCMSTPNYEYQLGRWGIIREIKDKMEKGRYDN